ncbi:DUF3616 domain-containing protein [Nonomuraea rubra]|uniref:DUF3616 domain-containing protein n=1 Tax=Nonomuraea rubra TaxID=46180 RepID=UPI003607848C
MEQVELRFDHASRASQTHTNLSALRQSSTGLWVAGDETASFEHLTWTGDHYGDQRTFMLADYIALPAGPQDEADIEGLARANGYLWLVGSHSLKRRKVKSKDPEKGAERLATVIREENRFILARLPWTRAPSCPSGARSCRAPRASPRTCATIHTSRRSWPCRARTTGSTSRASRSRRSTSM